MSHAAIDNGRSVNAEIVARLEQSFSPDPATHLAELLGAMTFLTDQQRSDLIAHLSGAMTVLSAARERPEA